MKNNVFNLIIRFSFFSILYCLLTSENIFGILQILFLSFICISIIKIINKKNNAARYLAFSSLILILPLWLPASDFKESLLPSGYQYISISLISSLIYMVFSIDKEAGRNSFESFLITATATLAPTSYISGPSATYKELSNKQAFKFGIPQINNLGTTNIILLISGFFRLSVGYFLTTLDVNQIIQGFTLLNLLNIKSFVLIIILGFYNFWKYYLLFSGASEICKSVLCSIGINVIDNFNNPESSVFYHQIWSRWHLNITERVQNYLYTPITLYGLRTFSNFNKFLKYIAIEALPIITLFSILAIWHGGKPRDFLYGFVSTILTIISRSISKNNYLNTLLDKFKIFKQIFRFINLSIFGICFFIYDFISSNSSYSVLTDFKFSLVLPYIFSSILIYIYFLYKIHNQEEIKNNGITKTKPNSYFISLEIIAIIFINIYLLPGNEVGSNFIYFAN